MKIPFDAAKKPQKKNTVINANNADVLDELFPIKLILYFREK